MSGKAGAANAARRRSKLGKAAAFAAAVAADLFSFVSRLFGKEEPPAPDYDAVVFPEGVHSVVLNGALVEFTPKDYFDGLKLRLHCSAAKAVVHHWKYGLIEAWAWGDVAEEGWFLAQRVGPGAGDLRIVYARVEVKRGEGALNEVLAVSARCLENPIEALAEAAE